MYVPGRRYLYSIVGRVSGRTTKICHAVNGSTVKAKAGGARGGEATLSSRTVYRRYTVFLNVVLCATVFIPHAKQAQASTAMPITTISISLSSPYAVSHLQMGATNAEGDMDPDDGGQMMSFAEQLMQKSLFYQNQHIMGWGAGDPEPTPGVYDWESLDERVQMMRSTHTKMVLTLCCAPGWMRPQGYQNDWGDLDVAPDPQHVRDFARLAKAVALRYPDVKYFQVWNELKGMWSKAPGATAGARDRWDYERYTMLYNAVYDAIKSVRPDAKIGGPYVSIESDGDRRAMENPGPTYSWGTLDQRPLDVITYWLAHKHGADFIAMDGSSANNDGKWLTDPFTAGQKFIDVYNWIRKQTGGARLPIWWSEWYAGTKPVSGDNLAYYNALMAADEIATLESKVNVALLWKPQGNTNGFSFPEGIWMKGNAMGNAQATPYYATSYAFKNFFAPGTQLYKVTASTSNVSVLASATKMMVVNHLSSEQKVVIGHKAFAMQPYQVLVAKP